MQQFVCGGRGVGEKILRLQDFHNIPNFLESRKTAVSIFKFKQRGSTIEMLPLKDVNRMPNSDDSDQTSKL